LDAYTAGAVTLLFRIITYWSIVVLGSVLYLSSRGANRPTGERMVLDG
jgi:uncharacterized membrane protein YbhN (UPF0104 family)